MARPFKHPRSHVYYFRKVVPEALRAVVGKREVRRSLGTKDPREAARRFPAVAAEVEREWQSLNAEPQTLTQRQIVGLAGRAYAEMVRDLSDEPGETAIWDEVLRLERRKREAGRLEEWCGPTIDTMLAAEGLRVDAATRVRLLDEVSKAHIHAAEVLRKRSTGDYRTDPDSARYPGFQTPSPATSRVERRAGGSTASSLTGLVEDWWVEAQATGLKPSTYQSHRASIAHLVAFLGHDDAAQVTADDVNAFKAHRLASVNPRTGKPISAKTVKDSDLAGLKSVFNWAVANRRMQDNPATGVRLKLGKRLKVRDKWFTPAEASAILGAAVSLERAGEDPKTFAAKRWVPWLLAYTGARVGELVQLRKQDIRQQGVLWIATLTPEAGTIKTNEARQVVLHAHLIEEGFAEFVASARPGHLFLNVGTGGDPLGPLKGVKNRVREFVRGVVTDPNIAPNHAWRHLFKTLGREAGIDERILAVIQGQAARNVGEAYGGVTVQAMASAMAKFPRLEVTPRATGAKSTFHTGRRVA